MLATSSSPFPGACRTQYMAELLMEMPEPLQRSRRAGFWGKRRGFGQRARICSRCKGPGWVQEVRAGCNGSRLRARVWGWGRDAGWVPGIRPVAVHLRRDRAAGRRSALAAPAHSLRSQRRWCRREARTKPTEPARPLAVGHRAPVPERREAQKRRSDSTSPIKPESASSRESALLISAAGATRGAEAAPYSHAPRPPSVPRRPR